MAYIESYKTKTGKRNGTWKNNINDSYRRAGKKADNTIDTIVNSEEIKILPPFGK